VDGLLRSQAAATSDKVAVPDVRWCLMGIARLRNERPISAKIERMQARGANSVRGQWMTLVTVKMDERNG